jgi:hypothetical protein
MRALKIVVISAAALASTLAMPMAKSLHSDADIRHAFASNTIAGENNKEPYVESLSPNGSL